MMQRKEEKAGYKLNEELVVILLRTMKVCMRVRVVDLFKNLKWVCSVFVASTLEAHKTLHPSRGKQEGSFKGRDIRQEDSG